MLAAKLVRLGDGPVAEFEGASCGLARSEAFLRGYVMYVGRMLRWPDVAIASKPSQEVKQDLRVGCGDSRMCLLSCRS